MTSGGALNTRQTYYPYGAKRPFDGSALPTDYTFTGQKSDDSTGLMFYGARYYDTTLGRFTQADTIVPGAFNPQALNRYAYGLNNPVRYTDPTGHYACDDTDCTPGDVNGTGNGTRQDQPNPPTVPAPTDNGNNQNPDVDAGGSCWPRCNRDDMADAQAQEESNLPSRPEVARGTPGNICMRCQIYGNIYSDMGPILEPDGSGGGGAGGIGGIGAVYAIVNAITQGVQAVQSRALTIAPQQIIVRAGEFVNRTYDSRWFPGAQGISGPLGRSFSPGSGVPTTAAEAIIERGLGIWSANNSQVAVVYKVVQDIPALSRTSLFGKAPEVLIDPQFFQNLQKVIEYPLVP